MRANRWLSTVTLAAALSAAACGGGEDAETTDRPDDPTTTTTTDGTGTASGATEFAEHGPVTVARSADEVDVHDEPDGEVTTTLPATTVFGSERALPVLDDQGDWLEVSLPERPNGSSGWVAATDVDEMRTVPTWIEIDLETRTLTLYEDGDEVVSTDVAIGTDENPTPTGDFFVTDKLETAEPGGAYGPFAFGLSAWSETLTEFAGGDGQVGIHGTHTPETIGDAVSHGCVRVPNDVAELLNERVHLGTPVTIS